MAKVEIYSTEICPYCVKAKGLLDRKGVKYTEYRVDQDEEALKHMLANAGGRRTVPQIFIDGRHIGGCDDLHELDRQGELEKLLKP